MFIKTFKVQNFINGVLSVKFSSTGLLQDCVVDQGLVDRSLELFDREYVFAISPEGPDGQSNFIRTFTLEVVLEKIWGFLEDLLREDGYGVWNDSYRSYAHLQESLEEDALDFDGWVNEYGYAVKLEEVCYVSDKVEVCIVRNTKQEAVSDSLSEDGIGDTVREHVKDILLRAIEEC